SGQEISELLLPGVDREKKPATTCKEGNVRRESGGDAPQGSADAHRVSQPRRRSHCQQNVRVRHDSLTVLRRTTEQAVVRSFTFRFSEVRQIQKVTPAFLKSRLFRMAMVRPC